MTRRLSKVATPPDEDVLEVVPVSSPSPEALVAVMVYPVERMLLGKSGWSNLSVKVTTGGGLKSVFIDASTDDPTAGTSDRFTLLGIPYCAVIPSTVAGVKVPTVWLYVTAPLVFSARFPVIELLFPRSIAPTALTPRFATEMEPNPLRPTAPLVSNAKKETIAGLMA